uniref:Ion transport domain-containing protein n=1 Tax=Triticum urartu TaxID=4572 RepID=A0A8R7UAN5_TRIUA
MPLDPDHSPSPPPQPPHRDWFFPPAPPFLPSSSRSLAPRAPFPSTSRSYKPYSPADRRPLPPPRSRSPHPSPEQQSPQPPSAPRLRGWDPRYAGVRRGDAPAAAAAPPAAPPAVPERKSPPASALTLRWSGMLSAAAILLCFASLLHRNFSLHDQVHHLRGQLGAATAKLQSCIVVMDSSLDMSSVFSYESNDEFVPSRSLKNFSLLLSLSALYAPIVILKYIDILSKLRRSRHSEDVAFNKRLSDCLWLSWTFVADAGNHANAVGVGPKLVSVSISIGGMLVFAMMLGLVTDSISEKFDSLRKGRSEVIEQSHTLILGWSDKLVILESNLC